MGDPLKSSPGWVGTPTSISGWDRTGTRFGLHCGVGRSLVQPSESILNRTDGPSGFESGATSGTGCLIPLLRVTPVDPRSRVRKASDPVGLLSSRGSYLRMSA